MQREIPTFGSRDWAAYFRVSAIDHPVMDASSILDFPTGRKGERERERERGNETRREPRWADRQPPPPSEQKHFSILFPESYQPLPAEAAKEDSISSPRECAISFPEINGADAPAISARRFELIGHPMGTAGARNNCPQ